MIASLNICWFNKFKLKKLKTNVQLTTNSCNSNTSKSSKGCRCCSKSRSELVCSRSPPSWPTFEYRRSVPKGSQCRRSPFDFRLFLWRPRQPPTTRIAGLRSWRLFLFPWLQSRRRHPRCCRLPPRPGINKRAYGRGV